jgi:hypothetical protein
VVGQVHLTEKDRAIELARQVMRYRNHGLSLTPSQSLLLATQYLIELGLMWQTTTNTNASASSA